MREEEDFQAALDGQEPAKPEIEPLVKLVSLLRTVRLEPCPEKVSTAGPPRRSPRRPRS